MTDAAPWLVLLPLGWAAVAFVLGPGRGARLAIAGCTVQTLLALAVADGVIRAGAQQYAVGGWGAPLGIDLAVDGLSAAMLLMAQAVALPVSVYAAAYFDARDAAVSHYWPLAGFLLAGLNALFISADLFNMYVALELLGLAAVGLVGAGGGADQLAAALRYLFATLIGSGAFLLGVGLVYGAYGTVSIVTLTPLVAAEAPRLLGIAGGLMLIGLMLKTALYPFHYWLAPAHGGAPAPVSALLSALVVKASFYLILRLWLGPFAPVTAIAHAISWLPAILGMAAILWGSWRAIRARRLKRLVAYSTVAQVGYLFLVFPLLSVPGAVQAVVMQILAHGLAKAGMFAAAGVLIKATGKDAIDGLSGVAGKLPLTLFAFALASVTLMGLPPSAGFLAKWQLIEVALAEGCAVIAVVVLLGGLLSAVYCFRVLREAFLLAPDSPLPGPVPRTLEWAAFALAAASILLGLRGVELMRLVGGAA